MFELSSPIKRRGLFFYLKRAKTIKWTLESPSQCLHRETSIPFHPIPFSTKTTSHCLSKARQAPVARVLHLTRREKTNNFNFKVSWKTIKENDNQETASNASMDENRGKSESTNERTKLQTNAGPWTGLLSVFLSLKEAA